MNEPAKVWNYGGPTGGWYEAPLKDTVAYLKADLTCYHCKRERVKREHKITPWCKVRKARAGDLSPACMSILLDEEKLK